MESDLAGDCRSAMKRLVAGTSLLTTTEPGGGRHGMLVTNLLSIGSPTSAALMICVNRQASMHAPLAASGRFCVNFLRSSHQGLVGVFTGKPSGEARFAHGDWISDAHGLPMLADALASLSCRVEDSRPFEGNTLFAGRVEAVRFAGGFDALAYANGAFRGIK